jgi:hypothetical protein
MNKMNEMKTMNTPEDFASFLTTRSGSFRYGAGDEVYPLLEHLQEYKASERGQSFNYEELACRTKSPAWHGDKVSAKRFNAVVAECISALRDLDRIKKTLFYGKEGFPIELGEVWCRFLPHNMQTTGAFESEQLFVDIVHCILGKSTEAGELLELLQASILDNVPFDVTNFKEEIGDGQWYDAIGCSAVGTTIQEVQLTNIAKLQDKFAGRFKSGDFNASEAINRNHEAERTILENVNIGGAQLHVEHAEAMDDTAAHAIANATVNTDALGRTDDAQVWAQEFMKVYHRSKADVDEGLMIAWFANCAETAKSLERHRIDADAKGDALDKGL